MFINYDTVRSAKIKNSISIYFYDEKRILQKIFFCP